MSEKVKHYYPKDIFGNEVKVGDRIVYIVNDHSYTVLNWAEVLEIKPRPQSWSRWQQYTTKVRRYAQKGSALDNQKDTIVHLTSPTILKVGDTIKDVPE